MKAKVLVSCYFTGTGQRVHRVYLEPDFDQAEKDLELLMVSPDRKLWELHEAEIQGREDFIYGIDLIASGERKYVMAATVCNHNWKEWEDQDCNAQMRCTKCKEIKK